MNSKLFTQQNLAMAFFHRSAVVKFCINKLHTSDKEITMVRCPGDKTPEPPGGRAAERLRMFEDARRTKTASRAKKKKQAPKDTKKDVPVKRR